MELININKNTLTMKYPSSWHGALWRDGLVSGNGKIGANIYGGVKRETLLINHGELWAGNPVQELPDVRQCLEKTREAMDEGEFNKANWILADTLKRNGYDNKRGCPLPLAELNMTYNSLPGFSDYLRAVNMETGEVSSQFNENGVWVRKDMFVSRHDDTVVMRVRAEKPILYADFALDIRSAEDDSDEVYIHVKNNRRVGSEANILTVSSVDTDGLSFGAAAKIDTADGNIEMENGLAHIFNASEITVKIKVYIKGRSDISGLVDALQNEKESYDGCLARHVPLHKTLYHSAELDIYDEPAMSNEELLLKAYSGKSPNELIEKLWRFGRYLFICGNCIGGLPFPMYGLWHGEYRQIWSHNMANENIQMIYWHSNVGNLCELNKTLFEYYSGRMDCFRDCAKKLYGCRGIFIPAGTTPDMPLPNQIVPVIMNWTGTAGWLAQHYYRHYIYTRDTKYLMEVILPFMKATADFYEDFIVFDKDGKVKLYPSVSPENTPANFIPKEAPDMAHPMPTAVNSTIDLAIVKELFSNLLKLAEEHDIYKDKTDTWRKIVAAVPEYKTNTDGAVKEWQDERFEDRYFHRHLSHLYPVFPGDEINSDDSIIAAFEKAVDLREIGAQTGWSLAHMASIYARLGRGEDAMQCLNDIARTCMQSNLFTLHNDWRRMDISLEMENSAPIQLDALMGYINAVQEMIMYSSEKVVKLLPALPDVLKKGRISGWRFCGGIINMEWDIENKIFFAELEAEHAIDIKIILPTVFSGISIQTDREVSSEDHCLYAKMEKKDILKLIGEGDHKQY